jgi:hypothetical protein
VSYPATGAPGVRFRAVSTFLRGRSMTKTDPYRTSTSGSTTTDKVVLTIGVCAAAVATIAIFVDHGQLRTAARVLLYATVAVGIIVAVWAGSNVVRTDGQRVGGVWQTIAVWLSALAILMPVSGLILRHHEKLVNCKEVRHSVRPTDHRQPYPPYSREQTKCAINTYIAHLNQLGTSAPKPGRTKTHH